MDSKKVRIRVDGSTEIGLGHLVRCQALAHMLKSEYDVHFHSKLFPEQVRNDIIVNGFSFTQIFEESEFLGSLKGEEIVVLDNYFFDTQYQKTIKDKGCKLVCIDDIHDKEFYADLIVNHAPRIKVTDYKAQPYTQFALGLEYALLRPEFLNLAKQDRIKKAPGSILICFGGSDSHDLTSRCLNLVQQLNQFSAINVVVGASYVHLESIKEIASRVNRTQLHHNVSGRKMMDLMTSSEYAIIPASGVLYEALAAGCKAITGMYVDNQKRVLDGFVELACVASAGNFSIKELDKALKTELNNLGLKVIDGCSSDRILKSFKKLFL